LQTPSGLPRQAQDRLNVGNVTHNILLVKTGRWLGSPLSRSTGYAELRTEALAVVSASAAAVWEGRTPTGVGPAEHGPLFGAGWSRPTSCLSNAAAQTSATLALLVELEASSELDRQEER